MTADVIVADRWTLTVTVNTPHLSSSFSSSICHHFLPSSKKKKEKENFSPLSPVMFKPFMLLVVVWGGCTMRSVQGIKEKNEKRRTLTGKLT